MNSTGLHSLSPARFQPSVVSAQPAAELSNTQTLLGPSSAIARLWSQLRLLAPHFRVALLTGEEGCGADAVAQTLHHLSSFADTRLTTLRPSELDKQLRTPGTVFSGDTRAVLYIPNVDRLSATGQQTVLRLIRLRRHRRVALIASTSRDLKPLVAAGSFHPELASVLSSLRIAVPALRERVDDLPLLLSQAFQSEAAALGLPLPQLDSSFIAAAIEFTWPGNLVQFHATVSWLLQHRDQPTLSAADLHAAIAESLSLPEAEEPTVRMIPLDDVVQEHVRAVLVGCNGNKLRAAEVLGISRSTLYRMLDAAAGAPCSLALAG